MLPIIAIFDTRITDCDDPMTLHRYALLRVQQDGDTHVLSVMPEEVDAKLVDNMGIIHPATLSISLYPSRRVHRVKAWYTHFNLEIGGKEYPVMDFDHANLFERWPYSFKARGDTLSECRRRQMQQSRLRIEMILVNTLPPSPKPVVQKASPIPIFVAQLIKEKAIASEEPCPISRTPFSAASPAALLGCFHLFDPESIQRWTEIKNECPVCKAAVTSTMII